MGGMGRGRGRYIPVRRARGRVVIFLIEIPIMSHQSINHSPLAPSGESRCKKKKSTVLDGIWLDLRYRIMQRLMSTCGTFLSFFFFRFFLDF